MVLRAEFPELKGKTKTEVFPIYKNLLGEPDEVDEYDGEVDYFRYDNDKKYRPAYQYKGKRWGIDLTLHHESDYKTYVELKTNGISLGEFETLAEEMAQKFGVDKSQIRLISYTWYNGVDEPVFFGKEGEDDNE